MVELRNECGHDFVVTHPLSGKVLGGFWKIETAVKSVKLSWPCELRWEMVANDPDSCEAFCMATNCCVARITKFHLQMLPFIMSL